MLRRISVLAALLAPAVPHAARAQDHEHAGELGSVTFPVTCNAQAQEQMHRAVAMLHSFWFPEARSTFEAVAAADPGCGIAHWGVAMTHFGNPMAGGNAAAAQASGWEAAQRGAAAGARSPRDQAYVDAAVTLFRDHATRPNRERMQAYAGALGAIVERHPEDTEAKIFHGIFMVATASPTDLTFAQQKRAADGLIALFAEQPATPASRTTSSTRSTRRLSQPTRSTPRDSTWASPRRRRTRCTCRPTSSPAWAIGTSRSPATAGPPTWRPPSAPSPIRSTTSSTPICSRAGTPWRAP